MLANFSEEEIILPKATVLGVAEGISESLIASVNDGPEFENQQRCQEQSTSKRANQSGKFSKYLHDKLEHLDCQERQVLEPVLRKYRHVFHDEQSNDFKSTDVVEHQIDTGDVKPIRRPPYRVPFSQREEVEKQVQNMLKKGVIRDSNSPWSAPAILVPKKSLDGKPKYRFCVDFRQLNALTKFDTYPLPVFEETVSTLYGSKYFTVLDCYSEIGRAHV